MATLRDEILAFKPEPNEPLHEICECYRTMVKECPNNNMTNNMIQQTFYHVINTTNQCVVNQLVGGNFMTTPYAEACEIFDNMEETSSAWQSRANVPQGDPNIIHLHKELDEHGQAIVELTTTMNQLANSQLSQAQDPKQVNAMEGVNMIVNKRRTTGPQVQTLGALPSDTEINPKGGNNTGHTMAVITRSGRGANAPTSSGRKLVDDNQVMQEEEIPNNVVQTNDEVQIDIDDTVENTQEEVNLSREHVIDIPEAVVQKDKSLSVNVPLVEALKQMPDYAKFMKDLMTKKWSMNFETIKVTNQVSAIVHSMAHKLEFAEFSKALYAIVLIPCTVGSAEFAKALYDLGANCEIDYEVPIILGRPFLSTNKALCDVEAGELTFRVGDEKVAILPNFDDGEMDGFMECVNSLQGIGLYNYAPRKLSLDLENRTTSPTKPSIEEPPTFELKPLPPHLLYEFIGPYSTLLVIHSSYLTNVQVPWFANLANFLVCGIIPDEFSSSQRKKFKQDCQDYYWDEPYLFPICTDRVIRKCVPEEQQGDILGACHSSPYGGHHGEARTTAKVLSCGFYWRTLYKLASELVKRCDKCQWAGRISKKNEMPLTTILETDIFDVWVLTSWALL
uniref:Uncharacterized protein LOC104234985 n=1 Tax=Nicotiana sylvestris TaxID=4096 RepID=A0A1U7XKD2_NICSY|nr:PREDICTED: uncharacterized protein LOC104234985 [Nicotiana sylvestris]